MRGTYVKNGEITEVYIGNGITQIFPPEESEGVACEREEIKTIDAFTFMPKNVQEKKKNKRGRNIIIFLSVIAPVIALCFFATTLIFYPIIFWIFFLGSFSWVSIVLYANTIHRLKKND